MKAPLLSLEARLDADVILARQRARQIAGLLGFSLLDQTRVATAVSEIVRNAVDFAGGGRVVFLLDNQQPLTLWIQVHHRTPGLKEFQAIVDGAYSPQTALDAGILSARRLMDRFEVESGPAGPSITSMAKTLTRKAGSLAPQELARISADLAKNSPKGLIDELQVQNQELLRALQELRERQNEVSRMHERELEETNRGVVALYTELDDDVKTWRRMSDLKTKFLSSMSHEFRSPLNTILNLSGFLLDRSDGDLTGEQEKQVRFIRRAAEGLSSLVNDLLDIAKVEAGKATVRTDPFRVESLFENLRDATRPLIESGAVSLRFDDAAGFPPLRTDEGKVAQVLRNFLSNAVKYTERGEIRVSASRGPNDVVVFSVSDTGIGIPAADQEHVFEEFVQIEGPLQGRIKGTGLGLPLCRKLAKLLGGSVYVRSEPGVGSTFFFIVPRVFDERDLASQPEADSATLELDPTLAPILIVEDNPVDLLMYEKILENSGFQLIPARTLSEARRLLRKVRPVAILLDILLEAESGWTLLTEMKERPETRDIPIIVLTVVDGQERAIAMGAHDFCMKPIDRSWLLGRLDGLRAEGPLRTVLIVDDEEPDREALREMLSAMGRFAILEAETGSEGLRLARDREVHVILLDLVLPDMTGFEALDRLERDPATREIPVIVSTPHHLPDEDLARLGKSPKAIVSKSSRERERWFAMVREALVKAGLSPVEAAGGP